MKHGIHTFDLSYFFEKILKPFLSPFTAWSSQDFHFIEGNLSSTEIRTRTRVEACKGAGTAVSFLPVLAVFLWGQSSKGERCSWDILINNGFCIFLCFWLSFLAKIMSKHFLKGGVCSLKDMIYEEILDELIDCAAAADYVRPGGSLSAIEGLIPSGVLSYIRRRELYYKWSRDRSKSRISGAMRSSN